MDASPHNIGTTETWEQRVADWITAFCGNMKFVYFHIVWFGVWILLNILAWVNSWDPFPFGLLTMIVSLEAILLSTFILISQNRQSEKSNLRAQRDYEVDKKAEREVQEIKKILVEILDNQKKILSKPR